MNYTVAELTVYINQHEVRRSRDEVEIFSVNTNNSIMNVSHFIPKGKVDPRDLLRIDDPQLMRKFHELEKLVLDEGYECVDIRAGRSDPGFKLHVKYELSEHFISWKGANDFYRKFRTAYDGVKNPKVVLITDNDDHTAQAITVISTNLPINKQIILCVIRAMPTQ